MLRSKLLSSISWQPSVIAVLFLSSLGMSGAGHAQGATAETAFMDEIVVSARKRVETLQDVPLAVSALQAVDLEKARIQTATDLFGRVPSLYFTSSAAGPTSDFMFLVLRGVGFNGGQEPAVGVFIDGMYQPQLGFDVSFLDLERMEMLRGPQGTVFGRNTQGGALNLVTRKPDENFRGKAEIEISEFNTYRAQASVSGPLSDTVFAGINAEYMTTDGFVNNASFGGDEDYYDRYAVQGTLRFVPSDSLEIILSGDFSKRKGNEIGIGVPLDCRCYNSFADKVGPEDTKENAGGLLTINWDLSDNITLTSLTGIRKVKSFITFDFDGVPTNPLEVIANGVPGSTVQPSPRIVSGNYQSIGVKQDFISEELRLTGTSDSLDWSIGAYYFDQNQNQTRDRTVGPGAEFAPPAALLVPLYLAEDFDMDRDGWALFGQASWRPTSKLELTVGGRYSRETVGVGGERIRNLMNIENANPTFFQINAKDTYSNFSMMGSISYNLTDTTMTYFTISEGWKAGGFNRFPSTANAVLSFDSESSTNFEFGVKSSFLDNRITANLAAFYIKIKDQQLGTVTPDNVGVPVSTITNAGSSRSQGVELEVNARPTDDFRLSFSGSYTDTKFTDFTEVGAGGQQLVRDGEAFPFVPEFMASATAEYIFHIGDETTLEVSASYRYVDGYMVPDIAVGAVLGASLPVPSYDRVDARVTLGLRDNWRITGYVSNLFDSYDYTNITYENLGGQAPDSLFVIPLQPRQFGLIVRKTF